MRTLPTSRAMRTGAVAAVSAALLVLSACGGTTRDDDGDDDAQVDGETTEEPTGDAADPGAEVPEGLSVTFLPKQINNPYFDIAAAGGDAAVGEFAGEFNQVGPSDATASSQVSYINTLTQQGVDVIVTSANDPNAICPALEEARDGGAKIVTYDSDTDASCRDVFVNQASPEGIAQVQIEMVADLIGGEGEIAILSATANATNQNAWIALMEEELQKPEYEGIELVATVYGDDDDQKSFQETQGLLQSHPDLKAIIAPTTVGIAAAARYIDGSDYKGQVHVTGLGTPNQMREFVHNGTVEQFALWNPEELGYLAAWTGAALAAGQITGAPGETFSAGDLGEYEIGEGSVVLLGPPTVFDSNNIDDFDF
ncbi:MAG TPA: rhamnose ABC transporter substrate-binding protein [Jiangellaceae bacterium]